MSWRYLRTSNHLTNISKSVLYYSQYKFHPSTKYQQQQQQLVQAKHSKKVTSKLSETIMKLFFKSNSSIANITIMLATSFIAAWNIPLLVQCNDDLSSTTLQQEQSEDRTHVDNITVDTSNTETIIATSSSSPSSSSSSHQQRQKDNKTCPSYGCPLLPKDIYFDKEAQAALQTLRQLQTYTVVEEEKETTEEKNNDNIASSYTNDDDHNNMISSGEASISLFYNEAYINTDRSEDQATLTLIGYKGGQIDEQINQDRAFVISPFYFYNSNNNNDDNESATGNYNNSMKLLGVFDGHARLGEHVSEYSVRQLPHLLSLKLESILSSSSSSLSSPTSIQEQKEQIKEAINDTFIEVDKTAPAHESGGCTASIVLQIRNHVYIANAGDSRSFIVTYNRQTKTTSIAYITREDKPDIPEERQRVEQAGGVVYIPPPDRVLLGASSRVVYVDKKSGSRNGLAMSRSIGDWAAAAHGVIPNPTVDVLDVNELIQRAKSDEENYNQECIARYDEEKKDNESCHQSSIEVFAVSATDGLLDFMNIDDIANTLAKSLYEKESPHLLSACESLITSAASAWWHAKDGRYRDDIAIAVSKLNDY